MLSNLAKEKEKEKTKTKQTKIPKSVNNMSKLQEPENTDSLATPVSLTIYLLPAPPLEKEAKHLVSQKRLSQVPFVSQSGFPLEKAKWQQPEEAPVCTVTRETEEPRSV